LKPATPTFELPQIRALDRTARGSANKYFTVNMIIQVICEDIVWKTNETTEERNGLDPSCIQLTDHIQMNEMTHVRCCADLALVNARVAMLRILDL